MLKSALFSPDRRYRYKLSRIWAPSKPRILFIGLNPSTADEVIDDATVRRCIGFAQSWGYGGIYMGNLFNLVSTNPAKLLTAQPIEHKPGEGLATLYDMVYDSALVVAAWGKLNQRLQERANTVTNIVAYMGCDTLHCLRVNKDGSPKHPLYLRSDTKLVLWEAHYQQGATGWK